TSKYFPENSSFWSIWFAMPAMLSRGRCCCNTSGICISTPPPTSSMSTSGACAARSTASRSIHSSIRSAASGTVSVLLAKTLRSTTFKLALISIGIFGVIVIALFSYVYWATASYMHSRSDRAIMAEDALLQRTYQSAGRDALIALIAQRIAADHLPGDRYYLL